MRIASVVGTRPQLIETAELFQALRARHDEIFVAPQYHGLAVIIRSKFIHMLRNHGNELRALALLPTQWLAAVVKRVGLHVLFRRLIEPGDNRRFLLVIGSGERGQASPFWNVLPGEMSLVGPRPAPPREGETYNLWHRRRLSMKPGITGLWQVTARGSNNFDQRAEFDLAYIDRWSFWLDLKILIRTIPAAFEGR